MDKGTEEKVVNSLSSDNPEILPYLPYLLQDLWEIGSSPDDMIDIIERNVKNPTTLKILDLACGKGAVSVRIAKQMNASVKGIDFFPEFIDYAKQKAGEHGVADLCFFVHEDINESVHKERNYDIVIYGAVGKVLGRPLTILKKLRKTIRPNGYIIIDESYLKNNASTDNVQFTIGGEYLTRDKWLKIFKDSKVKLIEELTADSGKLDEVNSSDIKAIENRAQELKRQFPEKALLFDTYVASQKAEISDIDNILTGATWLLQRID